MDKSYPTLDEAAIERMIAESLADARLRSADAGNRP